VYDLVQERVAWFSRQGAAVLRKTVAVNAPTYGVSWGADNTPSTMAAGATTPVTLTFTNAGSLNWAASGGTPVHASYHWKANACPGAGTTVWDGLRTTLPADVGPGGTVAGLTASVQAPGTAGTYCLVYDLVQEGVAWFSRQGAAVLTRTVTVN
jgi:hypothetical protein